jgi:hypothetical protein
LKHAHTIVAPEGLTRAIWMLVRESGGMSLPQIGAHFGAPPQALREQVRQMVRYGYLNRLERLCSAGERWRGLYVQGAAVPPMRKRRVANAATEKGDCVRVPIAGRSGAPAALPELHKAFRISMPAHAPRPEAVRTVRATDSIGAGFFAGLRPSASQAVPMVEHKVAFDGGGFVPGFSFGVAE